MLTCLRFLAATEGEVRVENVTGSETGRRALKKATLRLIPLLFMLYIVSFLDRVNVGFAALQMNEDLGFSDAVYGLGAGIFFIGYFLFEVPSNLIMEKVGARVWIARIMFTWGAISAAMFLAEGIPAILLGFVVLFYLPDGPNGARWLEPEEREWLRSALAREDRIKADRGEYTTRQALSNGKVWLLSAVYFGVVTSLYGVSLWLPLIIEDLSGAGTLVVGLLGAIPYVVGAIGMVAVARHSDRTGECRWHVALAAFVAAAGPNTHRDCRIRGGGDDRALHSFSGHLQCPCDVLVAAHGVPERDGRGSGDRAHQLRREPGGLRRAVRRGGLERLHGQLLRRTAPPCRRGVCGRHPCSRRAPRPRPGGGRGGAHRRECRGRGTRLGLARRC